MLARHRTLLILASLMCGIAIAVALVTLLRREPLRPAANAVVQSVAQEPAVEPVELGSPGEPETRRVARSKVREHLFEPNPNAPDVSHLSHDEQIVFFRRLWITRGLAKLDDPNITLDDPDVRTLLVTNIAVILNSQGRTHPRPPPNTKVRIPDDRYSANIHGEWYDWGFDEFPEYKTWRNRKKVSAGSPEMAQTIANIRTRADQALAVLH